MVIHSTHTLIRCKWCGEHKLGSTREVIQRDGVERKSYEICDHCWGGFTSSKPGRTCQCRTCVALRSRHATTH